jgi:hypothetical protein
MARGSWVIAGAAAGVAAVLLAGGWFLLDRPETDAAGASTPEVAPTTVLSFPADPSNGSPPPNPYPTVPSERVRGDDAYSSRVRTSTDGRRLLVQVTESDCFGEEVRLRGEHADRVEVEIRPVAKPPPPGVSTGPDGSYGCMSYSAADGSYAVIELREPLGDRAVVLDRSR